jgi:hypothetical protein
MTKDEALDKALNALLWANIEINDWRDDAHGYKPEDQPQIMEAITAIRQARAAPVQPVGVYRAGQAKGEHFHVQFFRKIDEDEALLWTTPPAAQRQWVGLTDEERMEIYNKPLTIAACIGAVEAKLKEKNNA